jgi:two-component system chemotaxis response regulator CheB
MIRVLIVDDSALVCTLLTKALTADPEIEVVGAAPDPYVARDMIAERRPDVLTLDLNLPRMDGLSFLRRLMVHYPLPVIVVSTLTQALSATAVEALGSGAFDVVGKPQGPGHRLEDMTASLVEKVKAASRVNPRNLMPQQQSPQIDRPLPAESGQRIVLIGASTGGTIAIESVLRALPERSPAILIAQHMPQGFTASFAARLDASCRLDVKEATSGDEIVPGRVLIAPGSQHLRVERKGGRLTAMLSDDPPVNRHRPSVDVLFRSAAEQLGSNAVGVLLTGMGSDGARGLLAMRRSGARTIAEDESSCVVFGMPAEAIALGAAEEVVPLPGVPARILALAA